MKLLHLAAGNLFGGVESLLLTLAREQQQCPPLRSHFALCFEGRLSKELRAIGETVHRLGDARISRPWTVQETRRKLSQVLSEGTFDAVVCHSCWLQVLFGPVVRSHHLPLIFWCHDLPSGRHWLERWARAIPPDLAIANSHFTRAALPSLYPQVPTVTIHLPVSRPMLEGDRTTLRATLRQKLNTPADALVIIQVSRMEPLKGQTILLSALALLRNQPNWICWIVGGAQRVREVRYLKELQTQAKELGIGDRVRFLGQRGDVPALLAAADLCCQPNLQPEAFGMTFVEALYAGLPIVTSAIGGALEIVDSSCGVLVPPEDVITLSDTLGSLMEHPEWREALAIGGPIQADQLCNPHQQLTRLYRVLDRVIHSRSLSI